MKITEKQKEIILYVFFGGLTTAVSLGTYFIFRWLIGGENTQIPTAVSWIFAVTFAYITNKIWVFKSKRNSKKSLVLEFTSFYGARVFTLLVDLFMTFLLVNIAAMMGGLREFIAKCAVNVVILALNYLLSKLLVFRKRQ